MSTGITIVSALYGSGSKTTDVTTQVTSHIINGSLNLPVSISSLNINDPAPGQPKKLTVVYKINSGSSNTKEVNDNDTLTIHAPPQTNANGLVITKAEYGFPGSYVDVTSAVQTFVNNGSISLKVSASGVGVPDPNPNKVKDLKVVYTLNGSENTETVRDGTTFSISAPPLDAPSTTPKTKAFNVLGSLGISLGYFVAAFIYVINLFAFCRMSIYYMQNVVPGIILGLVPYSSLWILMPFLFFRSMIFDQLSINGDALKNTPLVFGILGI